MKHRPTGRVYSHLSPQCLLMLQWSGSQWSGLQWSDSGCNQSLVLGLLFVMLLLTIRLSSSSVISGIIIILLDID